MVPRNVSQPIHYFTRTCANGVAIKSDGFQNEATLGVSFLTVRLNDVPQVDEFKCLFDEYKILSVEQLFCYNRNSADSSGVATLYPQLPWLYTVYDYNDTAAITTLDDAMEYETFQIATLTSDHNEVRRYKPEPSLAYRNRWLSTADDGAVVHYGMKMAVDTGDINPTPGIEIGILRVFTKFHLAFRTVN